MLCSLEVTMKSREESCNYKKTHLVWLYFCMKLWPLLVWSHWLSASRVHCTVLSVPLHCPCPTEDWLAGCRLPTSGHPGPGHTTAHCLASHTTTTTRLSDHTTTRSIGLLHSHNIHIFGQSSPLILPLFLSLSRLILTRDRSMSFHISEGCHHQMNARISRALSIDISRYEDIVTNGLITGNDKI